MPFSSAKKDSLFVAYSREIHELVRAYRFGGEERIQQLITELRSKQYDKDLEPEFRITKSDQTTLIDLAKDIAAYLIILDNLSSPEQVLFSQMKEI